jgi:hypothetical protein
MSIGMNQIQPDAVYDDHPDLAPSGTPPHVAIAPELVGKDYVVIRDEDDTDEDYETRRRLLDAALALPGHS